MVIEFPEYYQEIKKPMNFTKLKDIYFNKKNKPNKEIKNFYKDLNLIWSNCLMFNEDNSAISKEAIRLKKLANKLIKEKIIDKVSTFKLDSEEEEDNINEISITKNKPAKSEPKNKATKESLITKNNEKKNKLQTSTNLKLLIDYPNKNKNKSNTSKNLLTVEIKKDFKSPAIKNIKPNNIQPKKSDKQIISNINAKSDDKGKINSKIKKVIKDDSLEESNDEIKKESNSQNYNNKVEDESKFEKTVNILSEDCSKGSISLNQTEKENIEKKDPNETKEEEKILMNVNEDNFHNNPNATNDEKEEFKQNSILFDILENLQVNQEEKKQSVFNEKEEQMQIDEEPIAKEPINDQILTEEKENIKNSIQSNEFDQKNPSENYSVRQNLNELEKVANINLENPLSDNEVIANEIEMVNEREECKISQSPIDTYKDNSIEKIEENSKTYQEENEIKKEIENSKTIKNTKRSKKYLDDLQDDIIRFNYRLAKKDGEEELNIFNGIKDKLKRTKNKVDYKNKETIKLITKNKKALKTTKEKESNEITKTILNLNEKNDVIVSDSSDNEDGNKTNQTSEKSKFKENKTLNYSKKKNNNQTINLNEDETIIARDNNDEKKKTKKTKKTKKFKENNSSSFAEEDEQHDKKNPDSDNEGDNVIR